MLFDDDSDLTEFDDEEEVPLSSQRKTKKKGKEAQDPDGYHIRGALRVPRVANYTAQSLHDQIMAGDIDLNPEYQRDVVWPDAKQIGLIDSLFRNFYVPPIIFVVETRDDGSEHRTCVDGKQRLTSINRFIQGVIPYKDPHTNEKMYYERNGLNTSTKGKQLPERYKKLFRNKQIVCIEYEHLKAENEREIFQRVQMGMALTPAEKLQAISSPHATFVRELLNAYMEERVAVVLELDTGRANDFKCVATAVHTIENWPRTDIVSTTQLSKWVEKKEDLPGKLQQGVREAFNIFTHLVEDPKLKREFELRDGNGKLRNVAPVEFVAACVLVWQFKSKFTMAQLADAIRLMRKDIRDKEKDIRLNGRCAKIMFEFIQKLKIKNVKADLGKAVALKALPTAPKRKRDSSSDEEEEESEEEEVRAPAKKTKKAAAAKSTPAKPPTSSQNAAITRTSPSTAISPAGLPLPRGSALDSNTPTATSSYAAPIVDLRRQSSDVTPKDEPPPTPVASSQQPPFAHSPPSPPANWTNPYPTPHPVPGQTPPTNWQPSQPVSMHSDRLAFLRAAKEYSYVGTPPQSTPAGPRGYPYTPTGLQAGTVPNLLESLLSRIGDQTGQVQDFGSHGPSQPHGSYNEGYGRPQDGGWGQRGGYHQNR